MLDYGVYRDIADAVLEKLNIPEDIYKTWDSKSNHEFNTKYFSDESFIESLVDEELANYDTSENHPSDIEDIKNNAYDLVFSELDELNNKYYRYQEQLVNEAYADLVDVIENSEIANVVAVDTEFDPADPDVGIYEDTRAIVLTLSSGAIITLNVQVEEA